MGLVEHDHDHRCSRGRPGEVGLRRAVEEARDRREEEEEDEEEHRRRAEHRQEHPRGPRPPVQERAAAPSAAARTTRRSEEVDAAHDLQGKQADERRDEDEMDERGRPRVGEPGEHLDPEQDEGRQDDDPDGEGTTSQRVEPQTAKNSTLSESRSKSGCATLAPTARPGAGRRHGTIQEGQAAGIAR